MEEGYVHFEDDHGIEIGEVVYDMDDEVYFEVSDIGSSDFIKGEYGLCGYIVGTGEFTWNWLHLTRKLEEGEEY